MFFYALNTLKKRDIFATASTLARYDSHMQWGSTGASGRVSWQITLQGNSDWQHPKGHTSWWESRGKPCPGALGCGREGAGVIPSRWWAFRDPSIAGMTQTWLLLHRGHPGGDLWSRLRWAIRELLVAQCVRAARAYSHTYSHRHCAQLLKYSWWGQVSFSSFPSLTFFFFLFFLFPLFFAIPKVNTRSVQTPALTQQVQLGLIATHVFKAPQDEVWGTSSPACRLTPSGVSGWCTERCISCPVAMNKRRMEETDVENHPSPPSLSLKSSKEQIWALFQCGGNDCLILLTEKGCWSW